MDQQLDQLSELQSSALHAVEIDQLNTFKVLNARLQAELSVCTTALTQTEEHWRRRMNNVPGMLYQFELKPDGDMLFRYVSAGCQELFGVSAATIQTDVQAFFRLIHPQDWPLLVTAIKHSAYTQTLWSQELRILQSTGEPMWVQISARPSPQPDRAMLWDGYLQDITPLKQLQLKQQQHQHKLQLSEERYRALGMTCGQLLWLANPDGHLAFVTTLEDDLHAVATSPQTNSWIEIIHPDDRANVQALWAETISQKHCDPNQAPPVYEDEFRVLQASSGEYRHFVARGTAILEPDGTVREWVGLCQDVHDRKLVQADLMRSRRQLSKAQQLAHIGSWEFDLITQQVSWSEEMFRIHGIAPTQAPLSIEQQITCIHPDDRAHWQAAVAELRLNERPFVCEYRFRGASTLRDDPTQNTWRVLRSLAEVRSDLDSGSDTTALIALGTTIDITEHRQIESALRSSEAKFRTIIESVTDIIFMMTPQGEFIYLSPQWAAHTGVSIEASLQQSFVPFVHPDDSELCLNALNRVLQGESHVVSDDYRIMHQGGAYHWHTSHLSAIKDDRGQILHICGICRDITERKTAEEALRQSEERFRDVTEAAGEYIWEIDKAGCYTLLTDRVYSVKGFSAQQLLGAALTHCVVPQDVDRVEAIFQEAAALHLPLRLELCNLTPEGMALWEEVSGVPMHNLLGELIGFRGTGLSITERKLAEQQLRDQATREQFLNGLISRIRNSLDFDTILETTLNEIREVLQVDRCSFSWYYPEQPLNPWEIIKEARDVELADLTGLYPDSFVAGIREAIEQGKPLCVDDVDGESDPSLRSMLQVLGLRSTLILPLQLRPELYAVISCGQSDGSRWWIDEETELLQTVMAQLAIALNQAELYGQSQTKARELEHALHHLKQTQTQMLQSEKMSSLGQLVAGIAHEINNPVNFIHGNITHVTRYADDLVQLLTAYQTHGGATPQAVVDLADAIDLDFLQADLPKLLKSMRIGTERIRSIVLSLRTFSRLDEAEIKPVDLHEGLESTLVILQSRLKGKPGKADIEIIEDFGDIPLVECYGGPLNQVFMNLIVNAIDALEEWQVHPQAPTDFKPFIRIQTYLNADQTVTIAIEDNGAGMSTAVQKKLFDPFFTTKTIGKGTGMGLSISYQIVTERHFGKLECRSSIGQGSTFYVQIPVVSADVPA